MSKHIILIRRCMKLFSSASLHLSRNLSNKTCIFTKPRRSHYLRQYPTLMVQTDGSTYTARHDEPRAIIKFPVDLTKLSEEERLAVLENRKPKTKIQYKNEETVNLDPNMYLKYMRKK